MNESLVENATQQIVYQFERFVSLTGWWTWAGVVVLILAVLLTMGRLYRRDTGELPRATGLSLLILRIAALLALVFFFLNLERRAQQQVVRPSEAVVLIDTSQSMSLPAEQAANSRSRIEAATDLLQQTPWLDSITANHRVTLYGFDETTELRELASLAIDDAQSSGRSGSDGAAGSSTAADDDAPTDDATANSLKVSRTWALVAVAVLGFGVLMLIVSALVPLIGWRWASSMILAGTISLLIGGGLLASIWTVQSSLTMRQLLGFAPAAESTSSDDVDESEVDSAPVEQDWSKLLVASGASSRIGDAIRGALTRHDPSTLAGVLVMTDGQNNAGIPIEDAAAFAARDGVSIFPIGFGSPKPPVNVRIVDLDVPRRVYPGDKFALSVVLQASSMMGKKLDVEVLEGPDGESSPNEVLDTKSVLMDADGKLTGVRFELDPPAVGKRRLAVRLRGAAGDQNAEDDVREARYEVVARKVKVLLIAGGPTREYRFVRNLLHRDREVSVDVLLQTGQEGMSQEADQILTDLPSSPEALFEYDAIVAFDPDWMQFEAAQIELLDRWLSDLSGGLVLIAGPVHLPEWSRLRGDIRGSTIKGFFPVTLSERGPIIDSGRSGGSTPWPLDFTADGQRSEFLSLTDNAAQSAGVWDEFSGVYDFLGVKDAKPGAKVLAYFSDPTTSVDGRFPIYLASQFYGSGRVFFQGSGEMWRLRSVSDAYFETYYTKLIRWATEGRLLRDSTRGVLLVDKPRAMVGETISVRAVLTDAQYRPLTEPRVTAELVAPSGLRQDIVLRPLEGQPRPGTYGGQFVARQSGSFELQLLLGDALDEQILRQPVQVVLPTLELESPQRGDRVLTALAAVTGGAFAAGSALDAVTSEQKSPSDVVSMMEPRPQTTILPGTPDRDFHRRRNASLMWLIGGILTLEWLLRRLNRLA
ncbi:MAG: VWA domain-containing protein [Pirellulaceae bacterium]